MRLRSAVQGEVERMSAMFGMPTQRDLDTAFRKIAELERALRELRDQVAAGPRDGADIVRDLQAPPEARRERVEAGQAGSSERRRRRAEASTRQGEAAMNGPFDFSPEALAREAMQMQAKLGAGLGTLREVDDVTYGATEREEVWRDGKVVLYRFRGETEPTAKVPLLISYALVNRPYMVDLQSDRSIVKGLLARGEDVYIIDWGYPDRSDRYLTLEDYIERFLGGAVDHLRSAFGMDAINLLGICQGGAFALCYAALHPDKVRNLVTMVTPVDFHTDDNMLSNWVRDLDADLFVDTLGNVPADVMNYCYLMLKPFRLNLQKYVGLVDILDDKDAVEDFLRMEKWIFDSPDQAGEAFRQFIKQFYQANGFVNGGITHRRQGRAPGHGRDAGAQHLRRAGPPGAAGVVEGAEGTGRQRRLHRAVVPRRPHRHLRLRTRAEGSAADHPRLAGQALGLACRRSRDAARRCRHGVDAAEYVARTGRGTARHSRSARACMSALANGRSSSIACRGDRAGR